MEAIYLFIALLGVLTELSEGYEYCTGKYYYGGTYTILCSECCCNEHSSNVRCCDCGTWIIGTIIGVVMFVATIVTIVLLICCCVKSCPMYRGNRRGTVIAARGGPVMHHTTVVQGQPMTYSHPPPGASGPPGYGPQPGYGQPFPPQQQQQPYKPNPYGAAPPPNYNQATTYPPVYNNPPAETSDPAYPG